jgi:glycosyltransferase involved in cell wall biosynthesis
MDKNMISIVIPVYSKMKNGEFFLGRCLESIKSQSYTDYEIVMTHEGNSPHNTNLGMKKAKGDLIKILHQDDYFTHENALKEIVDNFKGDWLITGCSNNLYPMYTGDIYLGNNKLGAPSVLTIRNGLDMYFDEDLVWLFDCDFYKRMYDKYGEPTILMGNNVTIGEGEHQATHLIVNTEKDKEVFLMRQRYV